MSDQGQGFNSRHTTPRMMNRPHDPAADLLHDEHVSKPRVYREGCYICKDMEFSRMGLPLCTPCCKCSLKAGKAAGHIPADDESCDDCSHTTCDKCYSVEGQEGICTCDSPCCEVDVEVGIMTCGSQHCPTHGAETPRGQTGERPY